MGGLFSSCCAQKTHGLVLVGLDAAGKVCGPTCLCPCAAPPECSLHRPCADHLVVSAADWGAPPHDHGGVGGSSSSLLCEGSPLPRSRPAPLTTRTRMPSSCPVVAGRHPAGGQTQSRTQQRPPRPPRQKSDRSAASTTSYWRDTFTLPLIAPALARKGMGCS